MSSNHRVLAALSLGLLACGSSARAVATAPASAQSGTRTIAAGGYSFELTLPTEPLLAQHEAALALCISMPHSADAQAGAAIAASSISARLSMPAMAEMQLAQPAVRADGPLGQYRLTVRFSHAGDYRLVVRIAPPKGRAVSAAFTLGVSGAPASDSAAAHGAMHGTGDGGSMEGMHSHSMAFAGVGMTQEASGTSWQPAATPHYGIHRMSGRWSLMSHYNAFVSYDRQEGPRGDYQYNSTNWLMAMASRPVAQDRLQLRMMLSLEPLTVTPGGLPILLQSGEQYHGRPIVDRQHPHDLFMEMSARYTHPFAADGAAFLYAAPAGEPALGPTAFMHRLSAMDNPMPPITHHWMDSTHIDFGVLTLGAWKRNVMIEASYFTGREPNEFRYDFTPFHPDSVSGRVTYNPSRLWSLQASYGCLHSPEQLRPQEDVRRASASASYVLPLRRGGFWATTAAVGNNNSGTVDSDAYLLESELNLRDRNTVFARYEFVNKLGEELSIAPAGRKFGVGEFTMGYVRDVTANRPYQVGVGGAVTFNTIPASLKSTYGDSPMGFWLFVRIRPARMQHGGSMAGMADMH